MPIKGHEIYENDIHKLQINKKKGKRLIKKMQKCLENITELFFLLTVKCGRFKTRNLKGLQMA